MKATPATEIPAMAPVESVAVPVGVTPEVPEEESKIAFSLELIQNPW